MSKDQTTFFAPIINHCHGFREGSEILTSSTLTNNHCHSLRDGLETLIFSILTNNYYCSLKEKLKILIFSISINNHCHNLREQLEIQLIGTIFTLFGNNSDIPKIISSSIRLAKTGYAFWHRHYWLSRIKDLIPTICNIYKYIYKIILYRVLIDKKCLSSDIWPKIPD